MDNFQSFVGNLNELVQNYFSTTPLNFDSAAFGAFPDKFSYIYANLIKTKGPDIIKLANLQNYLSEWERPYSYGGFIRSIRINPVRPMDPPTFADGSDPNNGQIRKLDVQASYHPFTIRSEFLATNFVNQLKTVFSTPDEAGLFMAYALQSMTDGANDTLYRLYKEIIHHYWDGLDATTKTALTDATIPATIDTKDAAIAAVSTIRNYKTDLMFGKAQYSSAGFKHTVTPDRQRLYIVDSLANALVDRLKLDHFMGDVDYADTAGSLSQFLGIPVRMLDDLGGMIPMGGDTPAQLYPIFDAEGAVTGQYAATEGGTTEVEVTGWAQPTDYNFRALLTEDDFGNVFPVNDSLQTINLPRGGGYINTFRYVERICVANPGSSTIFFE